METNRLLVRWSLVAVWMVLIFILSAIPSLHSGLREDFLLRKLAHMAEYAVLFVLLLRAIDVNNRLMWKHYCLAALLAVLYAFTDEWHQLYVPGREGSVRDVIIDSAGIVGALVVLRLRPVRNFLLD